jgi:hypothetical protein
LTALQKLFAGETKNDIPLATLSRHARSETLGGGSSVDPQDEETERHLYVPFVPLFIIVAELFRSQGATGGGAKRDDNE